MVRRAARQGWRLVYLTALVVLGTFGALPPRCARAQHAAPAFAHVTGPWVAQFQALHDQTQRVVLLAPNLDAYSLAELKRALAALGVTAWSVRDAHIDPAYEACGTISCLSQLARSSQTRAALASVSRSADGASTLLLAVVDPDGGSAQARARIGAGIATALASAWKETSLSLALRENAMIYVESRPSGASVWVDDVLAGSTPFARQVDAGQHRIVVKLEGFDALQRTIETHSGKAERVEALLTRAASPTAPALLREPQRVDRPSPWNHILGATLALIAVPALVSSLNMLINDGQCLRESDESTECAHRANFDNQSAALFAGGVLVFSTGTTLFLAQPIR